MTSPSESRTGGRPLFDFSTINKALRRNLLLWIAPTIAFAIIGLGYALTSSDVWKASQALVVRDEAIGELGFGSRAPLGRFESVDALKRSLETILQIARNSSVAEAALKEVGPGKRRTGKNPFPTIKEVEDFLGNISVASPKGTELGDSEVIYLSVESEESQRAVKLTAALCDHLEARMKELRNEHARSIISELLQKKDLAERELQESTGELSKLEQELGADLGEMRNLIEPGGNSELGSRLNQIKVEMRQAENRLETQTQLAEQLKQIGDNPETILSTPTELLDSQPALRQLKDGYVAAQLRTAQLRSSLTEAHPRVQAALENEEKVKEQLLAEAKNSVGATEAAISLGSELLESMRGKLEAVQSKLDRLAELRAGYVNLSAKVDQHREQSRQANVSLAEARGRQEAAQSSSLITRLDKPTTGSRPTGPGKSTIVLGSAAGGLLFGLSLVYLLAPWQETQRFGRRKTDRDRRATDVQSREAHAGGGPAADSIDQVIDEATGTNADDDNAVESSLDHLTRIVGTR